MGKLLATLSELAAGLTLIGACAPSPESIQPAYVSETPYRSWTCEQLGEELIKLDQALAVASQQQNTARTNDTVGVILIGLPLGSMSGQSVAPQIALYKGQHEAVRKASIRNGCPEMTRIPPNAPPPGPVVKPGVQPPEADPSKPVNTSQARAR